jgi:hypothetical protein
MGDPMSLFNRKITTKDLASKICALELRQDQATASIPDLEKAYAVALADGAGAKELSTLLAARSELLEIAKVLDTLDGEFSSLRAEEHTAISDAAMAKGQKIADGLNASGSAVLDTLATIAKNYSLELSDVSGAVRVALDTAAREIVSREIARTPAWDDSPASPRADQRYKARAKASDEAFIAAGGLAAFRQ